MIRQRGPRGVERVYGNVPPVAVVILFPPPHPPPPPVARGHCRHCCCRCWCRFVIIVTAPRALPIPFVIFDEVRRTSAVEPRIGVDAARRIPQELPDDPPPRRRRRHRRRGRSSATVHKLQYRDVIRAGRYPAGILVPPPESDGRGITPAAADDDDADAFAAAFALVRDDATATDAIHLVEHPTEGLAARRSAEAESIAVECHAR